MITLKQRFSKVRDGLVGGWLGDQNGCDSPQIQVQLMGDCVDSTYGFKNCSQILEKSMGTLIFKSSNN